MLLDTFVETEKTAFEKKELERKILEVAEKTALEKKELERKRLEVEKSSKAFLDLPGLYRSVNNFPLARNIFGNPSAN
jgi:hypothetical protein